PPRAAAPGPSESPHHADEVGVQRKNEAPPCDARPDPAVHAVVSANHPAEEEAGALADRAAGREGEEEPDPGAAGGRVGPADQPAPERLEGPFERHRRGVGVPTKEEALETPGFLASALNEREIRRDVSAGVEAMPEARESPLVACGGIGLQEARRGPTEDLEDALDAGADRRDAPVGQPRGEEGRDLAVPGASVAAHEPDRIGSEEAPVVTADEGLEMILQPRGAR